MATYYVRKNGNNANSGSSSSPRLTIASGLQLLASGDTLIVGDGTYNESVSSPSGSGVGAPDWSTGIPSGSMGYKTIKSDNKWGALIRPGNNQIGFGGINVHHLIIDGFDIDTTGDNHCIELGHHLTRSNANAHHIVIRNCFAHDSNGSGFNCQGGEFYLIEDNVISLVSQGSWYSGISVYQCRAITDDTTTVGPRVIIRRNICYGSLQSWEPFTDGNGIICDDWQNNQNGSPYPNYIYPGLVENNVCWYNGGKGVQVAWCDNVTVRNNVAYSNNRDNNNTGSWRGELSNQEGKDCRWINNIGWTNGSFNGNNRAIGVYGVAAGTLRGLSGSGISPTTARLAASRWGSMTAASSTAAS